MTKIFEEEVLKYGIITKRLVLLPLNNNPDPSVPEGGTYWSLLLLDQRIPGRRNFIHFDSVNGMNGALAQCLVDRFRQVFAGEVNFSQPLTTPALSFMTLTLGQCSIYVIGTTKVNEVSPPWYSLVQ
jgi:hypothetical protein